ncbi:MAG: hypothetical protein E6K77_06415 [Candidatus Eisenbacteria bacterium]|uniref:FeoB-associated Cys-rich membrane protein n=1 Tax=Eiseniibacteriota bacterium TaxID=2212470 RepID=A0A538TGS8_UNCEI|nr:MAG: hypothetical protein E6K77_06415 [Candidatus Eisenbacteria bacterium]
MSAGWQDLVAALTALLAGGWLLRRWAIRKRARSGCDHCAAAQSKAMSRRTAPRSGSTVP